MVGGAEGRFYCMACGMQTPDSLLMGGHFMTRTHSCNVQDVLHSRPPRQGQEVQGREDQAQALPGPGSSRSGRPSACPAPRMKCSSAEQTVVPSTEPVLIAWDNEHDIRIQTLTTTREQPHQFVTCTSLWLQCLFLSTIQHTQHLS